MLDNHNSELELKTLVIKKKFHLIARKYKTKTSKKFISKMKRTIKRNYNKSNKNIHGLI